MDDYTDVYVEYDNDVMITSGGFALSVRSSNEDVMTNTIMMMKTMMMIIDMMIMILIR